MSGTARSFAWVVPCLLLASVPSGLPPAAQPHRIPLLAGQSYREARLSLLRAGWKPSPRAADTPCAAGLPDRRCGLFPELASCSHTGLGLCRFEWLSPGGRGLAVITRGAEISGDPGIVSQWFEP
jgi:hypothetical protein